MMKRRRRRPGIGRGRRRGLARGRLMSSRYPGQHMVPGVMVMGGLLVSDWHSLVMLMALVNPERRVSRLTSLERTQPSLCILLCPRLASPGQLRTRRSLTPVILVRMKQAEIPGPGHSTRPWSYMPTYARNCLARRFRRSSCRSWYPGVRLRRTHMLDDGAKAGPTPREDDDGSEQQHRTETKAAIRLDLPDLCARHCPSCPSSGCFSWSTRSPTA